MTAEPRPSEHLDRGLGTLDATMIVVGSMIGSGIFITSAESARLVGAPGWLLAAWGLAGVLTISGALCCAELAAMLPNAGGQYVFLREAYGPMVGFLFGWSLFAVIQTGTIAAVAMAFASFLGVLCPPISGSNYLVPPIVLGRYAVSLSTQQAAAMAMIALLTAANCRGLELGRRIQNLFTVVKLAALAALIVAGLLLGWNSSAAAFTSSWWNPWANGWSPEQVQPGLELAGGAALLVLLGRAMVGPLFSQSAWNNVTFAAAEVKQPSRNLPRALLLGCSVVVALYLLANVAYLVSLPLEAIEHAPDNRVATALMHAIAGDAGTIAMAAAVVISTFGCNNGLILAGARVYYAMARDGLFFAAVGRLSRRHVPVIALLAQGCWSALLVLPRTATAGPRGELVLGNVYTQLLEYIVSTDLTLYALMTAAVVVLRFKRPDLPRPYRTWGYPLTPVIYLTIAILMIVDLAYVAPATSGIGYLILLTGVPIYFITRRGLR
jgi:basic amino acid/polyamine antiporter, APA family